MARVRVQELLVGERGNRARVAAALVRIGGVGIERGVDGVVQHAHGVGKGALHLVEHHAVIAQRALAQARGAAVVLALGALRQVQLVVPALLLKNGGLGIDGRVEHRVQVHVHQVVQVLLVGGGNGVDGLVGVGHGVEERLHGALDQVDKRLLDGEFGRSAQHRVLKNMEHAGGIGRRRLKANGKGLVFVVACQVQQASARCGVAQHVGVRVELGHGLAALDGKAMAGGAGHQQRGGSGARVGWGGGHMQSPLTPQRGRIESNPREYTHMGPRLCGELKTMPADWAKVLLVHHPGIFHLSFVTNTRDS